LIVAGFSLLLEVLAFACLFFVPGHLAVLAACRRRLANHRLPFITSVFTSALISLLLSTAIAHGLGTAGCFTLGRLLLVVGLWSLPLLVLAIRWRLPLIPWAWRPERGAGLALAALLAGFLFTSLPPCQYVLGGSDDSTYLNAAVHLSRSGALFFEDPLLQGLPLEIRQVTWDQYLPGFYFVEPGERGSIVSHGFHFYTAFLAVLHAIGGLPLLLEGSSLLTLLSLVAIYILASAVAGRVAGWLAAFLLAINPVGLWFSRLTFAEGMCEVLLLGGAALMAVGWSGRGGAGSSRALRSMQMLAAGCAWGAVHLVKVDFVLLPYIVLGTAFVWWAVGALDRVRWAFVAGYAAFLGMAAVFSLTGHRLYFTSQVRHVAAVLQGLPKGAGATDTPHQALLLVALLLLPLVVGLLLVGCRRPIARWAKRLWSRRWLWLAGGLVVVALGTLYWWAPLRSQLIAEPAPGGRWLEAKPDGVTPALWTLAKTAWILHCLTYVVTPVGLLTGLIGAFLLLARREALRVWPIVVLFLVQTALALLVGATADWGGLMPFVCRRFLPVTVPLVLTLAFVPWLSFRSDDWRRWVVRTVGVAVYVFMAVTLFSAAKPIRWNRPWTGTLESIRMIRRNVPENVVWLAVGGDYLALRYVVPLRFLERTPAVVLDLKTLSVEGFRKLLVALRGQGRTPVLMVGLRRTRDQVKNVLGIEPAGSIIVTERTMDTRRDRLPVLSDFHWWRYDLRLYRLGAPVNRSVTPGEAKAEE